jgi:hypothetical protein
MIVTLNNEKSKTFSGKMFKKIQPFPGVNGGVLDCNMGIVLMDGPDVIASGNSSSASTYGLNKLHVRLLPKF